MSGLAVVDPATSHVASRDRSILDRVGGVFSDNPTSERSLYLEAEKKLATAPAADTQIVPRAEANTTAMIHSLVLPLGFTQVDVVYDVV